MNDNSHKWITEQLFDSRSIRSNIHFPSNLQSFNKNLPKGNPYKPNYIIQNHTMYPLFRPFIDKARHEKNIKEMNYSKRNGIMVRLGIITSKVKHKASLYYCPSCIKEQQDIRKPEFLDVFWNRIHLAPGVKVCHIHKELLKVTKFLLIEKNQHEYISLSRLLENSQLDMNSNTVGDNELDRFRIRLAKEVEWIFNSSLPPRELNYYRNRYIEYLKEMRIAQPSGRIDIKELHRIFLNYYPLEFLKELNSDFNPRDEQTWVQMIIQKNRKTFHPIRHILMMMLLTDSVAKFFNDEFCYEPFGGGPWECKSSVCKRVVQEINIGYSTDIKQIYGDISCSCGYRYRLYKSGKTLVLEFGDEWENTLKELLIRGKGIYQVADILDADIATIKKYALKNKLLSKWSIPRHINKESSKRTTKKVDHHKLWVETVKLNPNLSKTEIRKLIPATYTWLYRNDKKFLTEQSPIVSIKKEIKATKVDWGERDIELLENVVSILKTWKLNNKRPVRITKSAIGKKSGKLHWLDKFPEKFPKTLSYIKGVEENIPAFQMRRVSWVIENLFHMQEVREWEIYRKAGLRSNISQLVKEFIESEVRKHNLKVSKISLNQEKVFFD